jgi:hypothetical protein
MATNDDWEALTLGGLEGLNKGFDRALSRAREVFELQDEGEMREGPFVISMEVRLTWKGGGAVEILQRTSTKEPRSKDDVLYGQDTRTGIQVHKGKQDELPFDDAEVVRVGARRKRQEMQ